MEATAVTPTLFLGDELSIPHVYVFNNAETVVKAIQRGHTVLTSNEEACMVALLNLGVPYLEAREKINRAKVGLPNIEAVVLTDLFAGCYDENDASDEDVEQMWNEATDA